MHAIRTIFAVAILATASVTHAQTFSRESDAYCSDLGDTAYRAAKSRDTGHPFSVARARDGYRPNRYLADFDQSFDRIRVARAIYASDAKPEEARKWAITVCHAH